MSETNEKVETDTNFKEISDQFKTLVYGTDSSDYKQQCFELCQQYLSEEWTGFNVKDVEVKRLTSGIANHTYRCKVKDSHDCEDNDVVIRIYGPLNRSDFKSREFGVNQIDESIVALMASQNGIGPQVYGLFGKGLIMKYYPHRHFTQDDLFDQDLLNKLACKLANFHALNPPLNRKESKNKNSIILFNIKTGEEVTKKREVFRKYNFQTLLDFDFESEINCVMHIINSSDSPRVFAHGDFRTTNTMILEDKQLVVNDFDLSSYFKRGYDLATLFSSFDKSVDNSFEFKDESIVKEFIGYYIEENEKLFGKQYSENECNSVEHIFLETKVFSMIYALWNACIVIDTDYWGWPLTEKTSMILANLMINRYLVIKKTLQAQNIISN